MERCAAAADDEVDECFLLRRFEEEECEARITSAFLLFAALSLLLRNFRALALRDEFGSATSCDTRRRSFRRRLLDCGGGALEMTGLDDRERSASGSIFVSIGFVQFCGKL